MSTRNYLQAQSMLSDRAIEWVRDLLQDEAEPLLEDLAEAPGIPESTKLPATLHDGTLALLVHLGLDQTEALQWQRDIYAEAESFIRHVEAKKVAHRESQKRYRESGGEEYRERQREYTRKWRERNGPTSRAKNAQYQRDFRTRQNGTDPLTLGTNIASGDPESPQVSEA